MAFPPGCLTAAPRRRTAPAAAALPARPRPSRPAASPPSRNRHRLYPAAHRGRRGRGKYKQSLVCARSVRSVGGTGHPPGTGPAPAEPTAGSVSVPLRAPGEPGTTAHVPRQARGPSHFIVALPLVSPASGHAAPHASLHPGPSAAA